jgi:hypothetical protein
MGRRDKIDVVAPAALQGEHNLGQIGGAYGRARTAVAYVVVLAEKTTEIAASKEDCPGAVPPDERGLFAVVWSGAGYQRRGRAAARAGLSFQPTGATGMRTEYTRALKRAERLRTFPQLFPRETLQIQWCHLMAFTCTDGTKTIYGSRQRKQANRVLLKHTSGGSQNNTWGRSDES